MKKILVEFYVLPIWTTVLMVFLLLALCAIFQRKYQTMNGRQQAFCKLFESVLFILWLWAILQSTIFSRSGGELIVYRDFFHQLKEYLFHDGNKELLRTLWMNVLLFVPGGLLLETLWPQKLPCWVRLLLTVIPLTALSVGIETTQYRYALGCVEADDVLCNGLGALLGAFIHGASRYLSSHF